ncbi:MAG: type IV toxin-antitoxin system AbiEi family antitoxin domain-containing protein [Acidimicrobiales bacterium]
MEPTPDQRVDRFAARHHGLVTRAIALTLGLTTRQIDRRLASGRWILVAQGLYRVASAPVTWQQRALAACLSGPPGTVASHLTAGALHDLAEPPGTPHVTLPPRTSGRIRIARVHRSPLSTADVIIVAGIPTTAPARTLLDCAGVLGWHRLCDMVDAAFCSGVSHPVTIPAVIDRAQSGKGRKGVAALRRAVEAWTPGIRPGSPAEMRLLRKIAESGLEPPERQIEILDADDVVVGRIDLGWRDRRAGFEYDSDLHHNPRHWERDESRQLSYAAAGWEVRRVGKLDLLPSVTWVDELVARLVRRPAA